MVNNFSSNSNECFQGGNLWCFSEKKSSEVYSKVDVQWPSLKVRWNGILLGKYLFVKANTFFTLQNTLCLDKETVDVIYLFSVCINVPCKKVLKYLIKVFLVILLHPFKKSLDFKQDIKSDCKQYSKLRLQIFLCCPIQSCFQYMNFFSILRLL